MTRRHAGAPRRASATSPASRSRAATCAQIARIIEDARPRFRIWSGNDEDTFGIISLGGYGVISVISHLVGRQLAAMIDALASPAAPTKRPSIHRRLLPLIDALFCVTNPIPVKYALNQIGFPAGPFRLPHVRPRRRIGGAHHGGAGAHRSTCPSRRTPDGRQRWQQRKSKIAAPCMVSDDRRAPHQRHATSPRHRDLLRRDGRRRRRGRPPPALERHRLAVPPARAVRRRRAGGRLAPPPGGDPAGGRRGARRGGRRRGATSPASPSPPAPVSPARCSSASTRRRRWPRRTTCRCSASTTSRRTSTPTGSRSTAASTACRSCPRSA